MSSRRESVSRLSRRQLRGRLSSLWLILAAAAMIAVLGLAGWAVFFSSWLAADTVDVNGTTTLSNRQILAAAEVDLGAPMVRLDLDAIHDRVAAVPAVASVSVHRSWPHTIAITVAERQPLAAVHLDGAWWVMDSEGVTFRRTPHRAVRLPVVEVHAQVADEARREAASVVAALPDDLVRSVKRLTATSMDSITLRLKDDSEVAWGSAAESARKVQVLSVLLDRVKAKVYDVSVPEEPTSSG